MLRNLIIYTRVSTLKQSKSLKNQENVLRNISESMNKPILKVYSEIVSGLKSEDQYELKNLSDNIQQDTTILIKDVSRLSRDPVFMRFIVNKIHNNSCNIYSALEDVYSFSPVFDLYISNVQKSIFYQKDIVKSKFQEIKEKGGYIGRPPFGYKVVKTDGIPKLVEDNIEQNIINNIKSYNSFGYSPTFISEDLTARLGIKISKNLVKKYLN